jgi:hypothetical protein
MSLNSLELRLDRLERALRLVLRRLHLVDREIEELETEGGPPPPPPATYPRTTKMGVTIN